MATKRNAEQTRQTLLQAAEEAFVDKGFDAARVDEIADAAGVNKRMIYVYFGHKEGLYQAVLDRVLVAAIEGTKADLEAGLSPRDEISAIVRRYFDYLAAHPGYVRLMSWEHLHQGRWETPSFVRFANAGLDLLSDAIERGRASGELRADVDVRVLLVACAGTCVAFFNRRRLLMESWQLDLQDVATRQRVIDQILHIFFDGIFVAEPK